MLSSRSRRLEYLKAFAIIGVAMCVLLLVLSITPLRSLAQHTENQSEVKELQHAAVQYRFLEDDAEAGRAIDALDEILKLAEHRRPYLDRVAGAALEQQRAATITAIVAGLEEFSSEHYGTDLARWKEWHLSHTGSR